MEKKHAHLGMIQGVVNRLSHNSFLLKGWSVILVAALFAVAAERGSIYSIILAYFPALMFWGLDGYFLWQERLFRKLYDHVRGKKEEDIDFSMGTSVVKEKADSWVKVTLSRTLLVFHLVVVITISAALTIGIFLTRGG